MSIDSPVAGDLIDVSQHSTGTARRASGASFGLLRGVIPILFGTATVLIGAGVIAAVATGANLALTLLAGYAAFAATSALLRSQAPATAPREAIDVVATSPLAVAPPATAAAWKLVSTFTVSDASRLLCNVEPGSAATQESIAWGRALLDAIKAGDLSLVEKSGAAAGTLDRERENPHYMTAMTREALRSWADAKGSVPDFLRT